MATSGTTFGAFLGEFWAHSYNYHDPLDDTLPLENPDAAAADDGIAGTALDFAEWRSDADEEAYLDLGLARGPLADFFTPDEAIAIARTALDDADRRDDEDERFEPQGLTSGPLDDAPLAAGETGRAELAAAIEDEETDEAWSPVWAQAPPDQDDQLVRAAVAAPADEEDEPPPEEQLGRPLAFPGDETGETIGARAIDEPGDEDESDPASFTAGPPDQDDQPSPAASAWQALADDEEDGAPAGVAAGPLDDAPAVDTTIAAAAFDAPDGEDEDDLAGGLAQGPLEDVAALDATIVAAALDAPGDEDEEDAAPAGATCGSPDHDDERVASSPLDVVDEDAEGPPAGPPTGVAFEDAPPSDAAILATALDTPGEEADRDDAVGLAQGPRADAPVAAVAGVDIAYETLRAWFEANWTATPRRFENEFLDPPADLAPFVFFELSTDFVVESEIGSGAPETNVWREGGEAVFHVLVASGTGPRIVRGHAEDLATMLKGLVLANGVRVGALSIGAGEQLTGDGNYFDLNVTAQWARDDWKLGSD